MKKHNWIYELIAFSVILALGLGICCNAVRVKDICNGGGMEAYYDADVPIDVEIFGTSHAGCTVDNALLWQEYGIASYTLWSAAQTVDGTYAFMTEAFRIQKPKVALVETLNLVNDINDDRTILLSALATRFSADYVRFIWHKAEGNGYDRNYTEELLFRFPLVHSRYKELEKTDFVREHAYNRGYQGSDEVMPCSPPDVVNTREEIPEVNMYYIKKIVDLCRQSGVELIFFHAPYVIEDDRINELGRQNTLADYCSEEGIPFLDYYSDYKSCNIDFLTDLREGDHLNDSGAAKVTNALAQYVLDNYDIADRRSEDGYTDWDTHARFVSDRQFGYALNKQTDINDYLKDLGQGAEDVLIIVCLNGNYHAIENYHEPLLTEEIGLDSVDSTHNGVYVIRNNDMIFDSGDNTEYQFCIELSQMTDLNIFKDAEDSSPSVILDGTSLGRDINGISISVYDPKCLYLIDDIYVDVYEGGDVRRVTHE